MTKHFALALVLLASCATDGGQPPTDGTDRFELTQHEPTALAATMTSAGSSVTLRVVEATPGVVDATFDFGDPVIAFVVDFNRGSGDFLPTGGAIDDSQMQLVDKLLAALEAEISNGDDRTRVEQVAISQSSFMQIVPTGQVLTAFNFTKAQAGTAISCSCFNQWVGGSDYRVAGKGCGCTGGSGNGCKGRCGQGCGITSSPGCWGNTSYTVDCARHDYGIGSWWSASDDYTFGINNCSCGGVGTCY
jgi:hypothetical protein